MPRAVPTPSSSCEHEWNSERPLDVRVPLSPELAQEVRLHLFSGLVSRAERSSGSFNATVRRRSGVERFHVHQLRHTFGCRYMESGGAILALREIMGHADIQTTLRYAALADRFVQQDAARVHTRQAEERDMNPVSWT